MALSRKTSLPSGARPTAPALGDSARAVSLQQLRDGDAQAFEVLFHHYYEALYNFAYSYVRSREVAEELVQDVFCRMWERRATLPEPTSGDVVEVVRAYLYRAVRNSALNWLRHQRVEQRLYTDTGEARHSPGVGAGPPRADAMVQSEEARTLISRAVASLPEPYRQVLALRSEHQMSYPEIAAVLQIPLKTVESRVTRAFRTLREALSGLR
jgi:RNA polymerase sigma-70 factor (ECF subfamily)